ncbi:hypothetical protein QNI23_016590 [Bermanella sp. WJH001]|uniref:hypothetical protein n=1 Tax=Bermanella sp. WJH001 TaxID=3048005 RepID=UPI0024BE3DBC|nr:hypothetical protein [Bermanella sp. WJH001]MDJ1538938.1 hypothetical protein [Bermanella sp. WJH001]
MEIIENIEDLPAKIQANLPSDIGLAFLAGMKTTHKPNSTIPILWLIWHQDGIAFCSTHRTRGLYKSLKISEVDSIRLIKPSPFMTSKIEIILKGPSEGSFEVTISDKTNYDEVTRLFKSCGYQIL